MKKKNDSVWEYGPCHKVFLRYVDIDIRTHLLDIRLLFLHFPGAGDDQLARPVLLLPHRLPHVLALLTGVHRVLQAPRLQRHRPLRPRPQHGGSINLKVGQ